MDIFPLSRFYIDKLCEVPQLLRNDKVLLYSFAFGDLLFGLTQKVGKKVKGRYKNDKDLRRGFSLAR